MGREIEAKYAKGLIYALLAFVFLEKVPVTFGVPDSIRYCTYLLLFPIGLLTLRRLNKAFLLEQHFWLTAAAVWWCLSLISAGLGGFSLPRVMWATINWTKGFVYLVACLVFLEKEDYARIFSLLKIVYVINFIVVCVMFFAFGYKQDFLGGIFGVEYGCNGVTNVFLGIILTLALIDAYEEKNFRWETAAYLVSGMAIAGLAEIKLFFLEFIAIVVIVPGCFWLKKELDLRVLRRAAICAIAAMAVGLFGVYLSSPGSFRVMIGAKSYAAYELTSRSSYKISRLRAVPEINEMFFGSDWLRRLFGFGFGNCEGSTIGALCSDFFMAQHDLHYYWFCHQFLYLETGLAGLISYAMIFGMMILHGIKRLFQEKRCIQNTVFLLIIALFAGISLIYDDQMRKEYSYIICFALSYGLQRISNGGEEKWTR